MCPQICHEAELARQVPAWLPGFRLALPVLLFRLLLLLLLLLC